MRASERGGNKRRGEREGVREEEERRDKGI